MSVSDRAAYLGSLAPGSDLDLRGTTIDETLLADLLASSTDPATGYARFGNVWFRSAAFTGTACFASVTFTGSARFGSAAFTGEADFSSAAFEGEANFDNAKFRGEARFGSVIFHRTAVFHSARFSSKADFDDARFRGVARFDSTTFHRNAAFQSATFSSKADFDNVAFKAHSSFSDASFIGDTRFVCATFAWTAWFRSVAFGGDASFHSAVFHDQARFDSALFEGTQHLGPLICKGTVELGGARFSGTQVTLDVAARSVKCGRTAFAGSVVLRLRYADLELNSATLAGPTAVQAWPVPFSYGSANSRAVPDENLLMTGSVPAVRLMSLEGVDAAHLVLTDVDLRQCQFTGAFHLDQIRIGFGCRLARPPGSWHLRGALPARWSSRKVLAEEQHWRARAGGPGGVGWPRGPHHGVPGLGAGPEGLSGVYQQLRKAFEEAGNEPDAADFYYGEMEMRRHDHSRPRAERRLLWLYWLTAGYGLRASRALSWLVAAMGVTLLAMMLLGLPNDSPDPQTTGSYSAGTVKTVTKTPDPSLTLPWPKRLTADRAEKGALVVVNSVVFRSSGQNLTLPGTVIEMASRIGEPVLLGLAVLAVRSRVKR